MFSWEIESIIRQHNYDLPSSVYLEISNPTTSHQITHVKYDSYSDYFEIWTNDGYSWRFKIHRDRV